MTEYVSLTHKNDYEIRFRTESCDEYREIEEAIRHIIDRNRKEEQTMNNLEILFRGKFGDSWKYGYLSVEPKGLVIKEPYECGQSNVWHITPETVGQYTGLTDKNGIKIFEGDIVIDHRELEKYLYEVKHSTTLPCYLVGVELLSYDYCKREIEVIGNIHDNPEFLEVD